MSLVDAMKRHVADMLAAAGQVRVGTVASVNPNNATIKVTLQPDGEQTGWVPALTMAIGSGWGAVWMPAEGDQVVLVPHDGSAENLICIGCLYSTAQLPPAAPAGELWLVHKDGATLKLHAGGSVEIDASGGLTINGNVQVNGGIKSTGDMIAANISQIDHVHTSTTPGTPTSAPIPGS